MLAGGASAADNGGHLKCSSEEVFGDFLVLENEGEAFPIDDENLIKIIFDLPPLLIPLVFVDDLADFDVGLGGFLESTRPANALGCFHFIPCDHPDFDSPAP